MNIIKRKKRISTFNIDLFYLLLTHLHLLVCCIFLQLKLTKFAIFCFPIICKYSKKFLGLLFSREVGMVMGVLQKQFCLNKSKRQLVRFIKDIDLKMPKIILFSHNVNSIIVNTYVFKRRL